MATHHQMHTRKSPTQLARETKLPASAKFIGYGVHLPCKDEFLVYVDYVGDMEARGWTRYPNYGLAFQNFAAAQREATNYGNGAVVVYMYDLGTHYVVTTVG